MPRAIVVLAALVAIGCEREEEPPMRVAAASSLARAFEDIAAAFEDEGGTRVSLSFAASGKLAAQIRHGAPFDAYAPADPRYFEGIAERVRGAAKPYARGRLVLMPRSGSSSPDSIAALSDPRYRIIAIAQPEHAPYGRAAQRALEAAGLWRDIEDRIVYASNVRQALQLIETGNADVALTARALIPDAPRATAIDETHYPPLELALAELSGGHRPEAAGAFARFLQSEEAGAILRRHGLSAASEPPPR